MRSFLKSLDSYGRKKLETEVRLEQLEEGFNSSHSEKITAYSLRLPDVIGPFDDSYRL
jgi:hypothetical protein